MRSVFDAGEKALRLPWDSERASVRSMTTISLELPDPLAEALKAAEAETGSNARELAVAALREFLGEHRFALAESHQREDIAAALREAGVES